MMTKKHRLTPEEKNAIQLLKEAALDWPESLWLFAADNKLYIMRKKNGERVMVPLDSEYKTGGGVDSDYIVDTVEIGTDGGDW